MNFKVLFSGLANDLESENRHGYEKDETKHGRVNEGGSSRTRAGIDARGTLSTREVRNADTSGIGVGRSGIGSVAAVRETCLRDGRTRASDLVVDRSISLELVVADIKGRSSVFERRGSMEGGSSRARIAREFTIVGVPSARGSDRSSIEFTSGSGGYLRDSLESAADGATEWGGGVVEGAVEDLRR